MKSKLIGRIAALLFIIALPANAQSIPPIPLIPRILARLVRLKQVRPAFYYGRIKPKRQRRFPGHAKRWQYGMRAKRPGELIQIDHMSVGLPAGFAIKEFKAVCPIYRVCCLESL